MLLAGVFTGLGSAIAMTVVSGFTEERGGPMSTGASGIIRVFGVYAAVFVGAGLLVAGLLGIVLSRASARHHRIGHAQHDTTLVRDAHLPGKDDVPRWVGNAEDPVSRRRAPRRP